MKINVICTVHHGGIVYKEISLYVCYEYELALVKFSKTVELIHEKQFYIYLAKYRHIYIFTLETIKTGLWMGNWEMLTFTKTPQIIHNLDKFVFCLRHSFSSVRDII